MKCCICCGSMPPRYYEDRWGRISCTPHIDIDHSVDYCFECGGFAVKAGNTLPDGRILCPDCQKIAVSTDKPFDWMLEEVMQRFRKVGFGHIRTKNLTIYSATPKEMAEYKGEEVNVYNGGFCCQKVDGSIDVYVQSHQTKIHFAGVLAHELMHVWCFQHNIKMTKPWEEGLSNLMSYYVYSTINFPLARYYEECLFKNDDPYYGDGFRTVHQYWKENGWAGLKVRIKQHTV